MTLRSFSEYRIKPWTGHLTRWVGLSLTERNPPPVIIANKKRKSRLSSSSVDHNKCGQKCLDESDLPLDTEPDNGVPFKRSATRSCKLIHLTSRCRATTRGVPASGNFRTSWGLFIVTLPPSVTLRYAQQAKGGCARSLHRGPWHLGLNNAWLRPRICPDRL